MIIQKLKVLRNSVRNRTLLRRHGVEYAARPVINGRLFISGEGKISFGKDVVVNSSPSANPTGVGTRTHFYAAPGAKISVGDGTGLSNCVIAAFESVTIGKNVLIGTDVKIYDTDFHSLDYDERIADDKDAVKAKPVEIGDGAFICTGAIILKGVHVGEKAVVGAGSVVSRDVPAGEVWAGNPAAFVKKLY